MVFFSKNIAFSVFSARVSFSNLKLDTINYGQPDNCCTEVTERVKYWFRIIMGMMLALTLFQFLQTTFSLIEDRKIERFFSRFIWNCMENKKARFILNIISFLILLTQTKILNFHISENGSEISSQTMVTVITVFFHSNPLKGLIKELKQT